MINYNACKDCPNRKLHCHSTCKDYLEFREKLEESKKAQHEAYIHHWVTYSQYRRACRRLRNSASSQANY